MSYLTTKVWLNEPYSWSYEYELKALATYPCLQSDYLYRDPKDLIVDLKRCGAIEIDKFAAPSVFAAVRQLISERGNVSNPGATFKEILKENPDLDERITKYVVRKLSHQATKGGVIDPNLEYEANRFLIENNAERYLLGRPEIEINKESIFAAFRVLSDEKRRLLTLATLSPLVDSKVIHS